MDSDMDTGLRLIDRRLRDYPSLSGYVTKQWFYRPHILVLDVKLKHRLRVAFHVEDRFNGLHFKLFGRDVLSNRILAHTLRPSGQWDDARTYSSKLSLDVWSKDADVDGIVERVARKIREVVESLSAVDGSVVRDQLQQINGEVLANIRRKILHGEGVKIGFLVNDNTKWNAGSLWDKLASIPGVECRIYLTISGRETTPAGRAEAYARERSFFEKIDRDLIDLYNASADKVVSLSKFDPDLVFYQQPWGGLERHLHAMVGKSLALYIPYQCSVYMVPKMEFKRPTFFPYLWRYYSQGDLHKEIHLKHDPGIAGRQVVTGYPKLDTYLQPAPARCDAWPDSSGNRTRVIYAPHHSLPKEALKISTFHWNHDLLLDTAKKHKGTQWIYKPHARLKYVVEKNGVMSTSDYERYVRAWREMENSNVYEEGEYFDIFKTSDVLITDCASFLGEYAPTGKPIIWLVSDVAAIELSEIGAELARGFYMVRNREEFVNVFHEVVVQRRDPLRELRMEAVRKVLYLGRSAAAAVADHLKSELGL